MKKKEVKKLAQEKFDAQTKVNIELRNDLREIQEVLDETEENLVYWMGKHDDLTKECRTLQGKLDRMTKSFDENVKYGASEATLNINLRRRYVELVSGLPMLDQIEFWKKRVKEFPRPSSHTSDFMEWLNALRATHGNNIPMDMIGAGAVILKLRDEAIAKANAKPKRGRPCKQHQD